MFDLAEVRDFTAKLTKGMDACDNGEGMECAMLDGTLTNYARLCLEFIEGVRRWGQDVFAGRAPFDPEAESAWRQVGESLCSRAEEKLSYAGGAEAECYTLEAKSVLRAALFSLSRLLGEWVTPSLSVGPSARREIAVNPEQTKELRARIAALPPLPPDWQPDDPHQKSIYKKLTRH